MVNYYFKEVHNTCSIYGKGYTVSREQIFHMSIITELCFDKVLWYTKWHKKVVSVMITLTWAMLAQRRILPIGSSTIGCWQLENAH